MARPGLPPGLRGHAAPRPGCSRNTPAFRSSAPSASTPASTRRPTEEVLAVLLRSYLPAGFPVREQGLEPAHGADLQQGAGQGEGRPGQPRLPEPRGLPRGGLRALSAILRGPRRTVRVRVPDHRAGQRHHARAVRRAGSTSSSPRCPAKAMYAVEVRNEEFLTPMYFAVLREHGVAHVFNSWTRMPSIGDQLDLPGVGVRARSSSRARCSVPGRTYDEAVDAFAPYDRIQDPTRSCGSDLVRLIETAVRTADSRLPARQQPGRRERAADRRRGAPHAAAGGGLTMVDRASLRRYAVISILAALVTIALKGGAYLLTGSVGLLSDALESLVNLVGGRRGAARPVRGRQTGRRRPRVTATARPSTSRAASRAR